jgi:hypothetical protein
MWTVGLESARRSMYSLPVRAPMTFPLLVVDAGVVGYSTTIVLHVQIAYTGVRWRRR